MANTYDIGDVVRCTATFTDSAGDNFDPNTVNGKYEDPSGNETTNPSITNSATGVYYFDINVDEAGTWYYRFEGKTAGSANMGAEEAYFQVSTSVF